MTSIKVVFTAFFRSWTRGQIVLVFLFLLINAFVLYNAIFHPPYAAYDSVGHLQNIRIMSEFRLPGPEESWEFFSPPLPYLLPAFARSWKIFSFWDVAKFAQVLNVFWSIGLTFYLIRICQLIRPGDDRFAIWTFSFLGILPVYYKTFAFIRGEPLFAFLVVLVVYQVLSILQRGVCSGREVLVLGITMGLMILCRHWGLLLIFALFVFALVITIGKRKVFFLKVILMSSLLALASGGWFYAHLYKKHGSFIAFNAIPAPDFAFSNQTGAFYHDLNVRKLFTDPVRSSFTNSFFPKFYSELWGDYECYFLVYGWDLKNKNHIWGFDLEEALKSDPPSAQLMTNRYEINSYLGMANLVDLVPTAILVAGIFLGFLYVTRFFKANSAGIDTSAFSCLFLIIVLSCIVYMGFLIMYPNHAKGDTIKATYLLHIYPLLAILCAELMQKLRALSFSVYASIVALFLIAAAFNFPLFMTRYAFFR